MNLDSQWSPSPIRRRRFLQQTAILAGGAGLALHAQNQTGNRRRAAIVGHTGRGDYGHGLESAFEGVPNVEVVAIADPDAAGRAAAAKKSKAARQYPDYRELLTNERPDLVVIAPRWTDQHYAMALAALKAGAHILLEKPFMPTLTEADEVLAVADAAGLKIAVAHQVRLAPSIIELQRALAAGLVGEVLGLRCWGKQDHRAGGEDMLVLGTHLFDLLRTLVGDPIWCTARILHQGRELERSDARTVKEQIGPVGGDEIEAQFAFPQGVFATFTSRTKLRDSVAHWGIEVVGSKRSVRILMDVFPAVYVLESSPWTPDGKTDSWVRWPEDPGMKQGAEAKSFLPANRRVVDDWLEAIRSKREPVCSGRVGMKALEMVMAVYQAGLSGRRMAFPLADRKHPLSG